MVDDLEQNCKGYDINVAYQKKIKNWPELTKVCLMIGAPTKKVIDDEEY